jgi:hypothetical protein
VLIVRFVHYLGIAMWIGGWLAAMLITSGARGESQRVRVSLAALLARVHVALIGPGAIATIGSGILWSLAITGGSDVESRVAPMGAWIMTAVGIVGGIVVAAVAVPTALRVKAVAISNESDQVLPVFERQQRQLKVVSAVAGICALVSLFAAVLAP